LGKATVSLDPAQDRGPGNALSVKTTPDGLFEFNQVPPGRYRLFAARNGYARQGYGQKPGGDGNPRDAAPIELRAGQSLEGIDFSLVRGGAIEGRILDQDGEPASRVMVTLVRPRYVQGKRTLQPAGVDQTDDRGQFRIYEVPPGNYYLMASLRAFGLNDENRNVYPPMYFPGVLDSAEAAKIRMTPGGELRGYDMTLLETVGYTVSGRVVSADGTPFRRVFVSAVKLPSTGFARPPASQGVGPQGDFSLRGLVPGSYRLAAQERRDDKLLTGSTVVEVGNQDVSGVVLSLGEGATLQGRLVFEGQSALPPATSMRLAAVSVAEDSTPGFRFRGPAPSGLKEDYTFVLTDLAEGPAQIVLTLPGGNSYVRSIRAQGRDITDSFLDLHSSERISGVEIVVASDGGRLSGDVRDAERGQAVDGATVLIYPSDARLVGPNSRFIRSVSSNAQGKYSLQGLVPGEYRVCALLNHESGMEYDPEFLQSLDRIARTVQLSSGQAFSENLEAFPSPAGD
jgi:hypothetical protein